MLARSAERWTDALMLSEATMSSSTRTWTFSLILAGLSELTAEVEDALYEAGCSDALLSFYGTAPVLDFDRRAATLEQAVFSAIDDVKRANVGASVLRVEPDDLVNAADIARRCSVSREAVRLWTEARRGDGDFPSPVARVGKSTVWRWTDVVRWLRKRLAIDQDAVDGADFLAALNAYLERSRTADIRARAALIEKQLRRASRPAPR